MSFSDSDWTSEAAATATPRRDSTWVWTLVLGVVVGAAGAALVFLMLERLPAREAPQAVATAPVAAVVPPAPAAVVETASPAAGPAEPPATSAAASPAEPVPAVAPAATTVTPRPSADEQRRKERAWAAYYRRPSSCDGNPTTDQLIECANHFIRSKREFEERWKAGAL